MENKFILVLAILLGLCVLSFFAGMQTLQAKLKQSNSHNEIVVVEMVGYKPVGRVFLIDTTQMVVMFESLSSQKGCEFKKYWSK